MLDIRSTVKIAVIAALLAVAWQKVMPVPQDDVSEALVYRYFARLLNHDIVRVEQAYNAVAQNVQVVLRRQCENTKTKTETGERKLCELINERKLAKSLKAFDLTTALFTLARIYDEAHITLCQGRSAARRGRPHDEKFRLHPKIDLEPLAQGLLKNKSVIEGQIILESPLEGHGAAYTAQWKPVPHMNFNDLPSLSSLAGALPGENGPARSYAGIGGGGGSDIISASLLGHLLRGHGKQMELLVSTRTWATGSQGKEGTKMGIKREIYNHSGPAKTPNGEAVAGTFAVNGDTSSEGRPLESIPVANFSQVFIVLDQGESKAEIPDSERADLKDQLHAVIAQATTSIDTVAIVDTGGDVFGIDAGRTSTPDQDLRVQQAMSQLSDYNLMTAVIAPGVDAPDDAPQKALKAGGAVYRPTEAERAMLLKLLRDDYKMDGSVPGRFGKTTMALQARLKGVRGWTSLDLPSHIVNTWDNPWSSFVYIRECMSDIILMPTKDLLPLIENDTIQS
jgi:hypothetical protein